MPVFTEQERDELKKKAGDDEDKPVYKPSKPSLGDRVDKRRKKLQPKPLGQ